MLTRNELITRIDREFTKSSASLANISDKDLRSLMLNLVDYSYEQGQNSAQAESVTGWANYADDYFTEGTPFQLAAATTYELPNNIQNVNLDQAPADIEDLYTPATLAYDAKTGDFAEGQTVTGGTSGATGIITHIEQVGTVGTLYLAGVTGTFQDDETITDAATGSGFGGTLDPLETRWNAGAASGLTWDNVNLSSFTRFLAVKKPADIVVGCFGDSNVRGANMLIDPTAPVTRNWPTLLYQKLQARNPRACTFCQAAGGLPYITTYNYTPVLDRLKACTHVILHAGGNDVFLSLPRETIEAAIILMADEIKSAGVKVILGTIPPINGFSAAQNTVKDQVNATIRSLAVSTYDGLVDSQLAIESEGDTDLMDPAYNTGDDTHYNYLGQQAIADAIDLNLFLN